MKKLFVLFLFLALLFSSASADVDLSCMTFDELVALRDQLNLAIWNSKEWQEVKVPQGVWEVGKDIPAGHWTISIVDNTSGNMVYTDLLDEYGKNVGQGWHGYIITLNSFRKGDGSYYYPDEPRSFDLEMAPGMYFIADAPAIFTPFSGKPDLGFNDFP